MSTFNEAQHPRQKNSPINAGHFAPKTNSEAHGALLGRLAPRANDDADVFAPIPPPHQRDPITLTVDINDVCSGDEFVRHIPHEPSPGVALAGRTANGRVEVRRPVPNDTPTLNVDYRAAAQTRFSNSWPANGIAWKLWDKALYDADISGLFEPHVESVTGRYFINDEGRGEMETKTLLKDGRHVLTYMETDDCAIDADATGADAYMHYLKSATEHIQGAIDRIYARDESNR